ncbi:MAG: LPS export ABC transporter ATP-binding protein [Gammaproteobacteria bacterium]
MRAKLQISGICKRYGAREVLDDVSISVAQGEVVGLLGANGAGKTTCFYAIAGIIRPDRGRVEVDGEDISALPMHKRARRGLSYLPQESSIFGGLTAAENVMAILEIRGVRGSRAKKRALELLEEMGVGHLAHSQSVGLSGGERRRVEIARLLATNPRFLLMDEPFAAIEPIAVGDLQTMILNLRGRGIGVFVTDHNVRETLKICDRAYILDDGKVLSEGAPTHLVADEKVRSAYLGENFAI